MTRRHAGLVPTLFPFLAVLVCTMGTLILLLALVVRRAEAATRAEAEQVAAAAAESVERDLKESEWQRGALLELRDKQTALVQKKRDELAHLEEHIRLTEQQLERLAEQIAAAQSQSGSAEELQQAVRRLEQRLEERRAQLEAVSRTQEGSRRGRISIIPHRGPNGTSRRPIYLECVADRVIIQPEGIEVPTELLRGPVGPGSPLDAALRTARTYLARVIGEPEPPYPLLIVRPEGVMSYAAARVSMMAWDDAFGYELVPADVELVYPAPDPRLRKRMEEALLAAVERQRAIVAAMPGRFRGFGGRRPTPLEQGLRASAEAFSRGSADAFGGAGGSADAETVRWRGQVHRALAGENTAGAAGDGDLGEDVQAMGRRPEGPVAGDGGSLGRTGGRTGDLASTGRQRSRPGGSDARSVSAAGNGEMHPSAPSAAAQAAGGHEEPTDASAEGTGTDAQSSDAGAGSEPASGSGASAETAASGSSPYGTPQNASAPLGIGANGTAAGGGAMGNTPVDAEAASPEREAAEPPRATPAAAMRHLQPLASSRGRGWALDHGTQRRGAAVRRNIPVVVHEHHYEIPAGPGGSTRMVMIDPQQPERAVVQVAAEVARRVASWGVALTDGHWVPVIRARVTQRAEPALEQLQRLLQESGVEVEREVQP